MILASRKMITEDMTPMFSWPEIVKYSGKIKINPDKAKTQTNRVEITISASRKLDEIKLISPVIDQYHSIGILDEDDCSINIGDKYYCIKGKMMKFIKSLYLNTTNPNIEYAEVMSDVVTALIVNIVKEKDTVVIKSFRDTYTPFQKMLIQELSEFYLEEVW